MMLLVRRVAPLPGADVLRRGATAIGAYLAASMVTLGAIALLDAYLPPAAVKEFLAFLLVLAISAGIDPGTGKAAVLAAPQGSAALDWRFLRQSAAKALFASPVFIGVWLLVSDLDSPTVLAWTPLVVLLGFLSTDVRVLLDARGRHAAAIWLKQGGLGLGIAVSTAVLLSCSSLELAIPSGLLARGGLLVLFARGLPFLPGPAAPGGDAWRDVMLTSALGALSASVDRVVALRVLDASAANGYIFLYEAVSKFWVLAYILAPILFVRIAGGAGAELWRFSLVAHAVGGVLVLLLAPLLVALDLPILVRSGLAVGDAVIFTAAIVVAGVNQLLVVRLQAMGNGAAATRSALAGLVLALLAFPLGVATLGLLGLSLAWIAKSLGELAMLAPAAARQRLP